MNAYLLRKYLYFQHFPFSILNGFHYKIIFQHIVRINFFEQTCQFVKWNFVFQARPTELLTNIFGRKTQRKQEFASSSMSSSRFQNGSSQSSNSLDPGVSLIDLSPPGSPTFTTRSSSDGVSVDSFGSDGNSNPSVFTSSGNTSQTESAFEDDFDFFGSLSSNKTGNNDPWKVTNNQDPFSPLPSTNANSSISTKRIGDANFFAYNDSFPNNQSLFNPPVTNTVATMPTIIRARPPKPPAPKCLNRNLAPIVTDFNSSSATTSNFSNNHALSGGSSAVNFNPINEWPSFDDNPSPPMPSIPPPAPPSEYLQEIEAPTVFNDFQQSRLQISKVDFFRTLNAKKFERRFAIFHFFFFHWR